MSEPSTNTWLQLITEQPLGIAVLPTPLPPEPTPEPTDDPALGERIVLTEDEVTRGVAQGEPFDPHNRYRNFGD